MISDVVVAQIEDQQLSLHKEVRVSWNHYGQGYQGRGKIVALSPRQVTVALLQPVGRKGEYAAGDLIQVPRYVDHLHWSSDFCVSNVSKEQFVHKDFL